MDRTSAISPNALSLIGLCNEYCTALGQAQQTDKNDFIKTMLRLLPRIYITATDLENADAIDDFGGFYLEEAMDEESYNAVCSSVQALMGADDTYLEVFEEDMKYSDTPIAANISEDLTDLMQVFYNFIATVKDSPDEMILSALSSLRDDFESYWSTKLCNVLRPLNQLRYNN